MFVETRAHPPLSSQCGLTMILLMLFLSSLHVTSTVFAARSLSGDPLTGIQLTNPPTTGTTGTERRSRTKRGRRGK